MFSLLNRLRGCARLEIRGDMPERFLNNCAARGIQILSARRTDVFTMELMLASSMIREAEEAARKCNCEFRVLGNGRKYLKMLKRRIFPLVCLLCFVAIAFWSKFYVWDIEISGNETLADGRILAVLADCGVESGAFWPNFSADNIRSRVLYQLPELSWITVNMRGSLAEVKVVERRSPPDMHYQGECSNIVADKDAFVRELNTLVGQPVVKAGSAVKAGDILISGVMESSFAPPRFVRSIGSVQGETNREIIAVMPQGEQIRTYTEHKDRRFALIIGNKRINFYSDSSISDSFCDKIISVWDFQIKDLFKFPLSLVCETSIYYELSPLQADEYESGRWLERCVRDSFSREIAGGELISEKLSFSTDRGLVIASLRVRCREEIGVSVPVTESQRLDSQMNFNQKADDQ